MKKLFLISLIILITSCSNDVGRYEIVTQFGYFGYGNSTFEFHNVTEDTLNWVEINGYYFQDAKKKLGDIDSTGFIVVLLDTKTGNLKYKQFGVKGVYPK